MAANGGLLALVFLACLHSSAAVVLYIKDTVPSSQVHISLAILHLYISMC